MRKNKGLGMAKKDTPTKMIEWICTAVVGTKINTVPSYECHDCRARFDEPDEEYVNSAYYYGVGSEFGSSSDSMLITVCPRCGSENFEEIEEYEEEEEDA